VLTTECDESCAIGAFGQPSHDDHNVEMPAAQQGVYPRGWLSTYPGKVPLIWAWFYCYKNYRIALCFGSLKGRISLSNVGVGEELRRSSSLSSKQYFQKSMCYLSCMKTICDSWEKTANALLRYYVFGTQVRSSGIENDAEA
jgi:hypothetical protein